MENIPEFDIESYRDYVLKLRKSLYQKKIVFNSAEKRNKSTAESAKVLRNVRTVVLDPKELLVAKIEEIEYPWCVYDYDTVKDETLRAVFPPDQKVFNRTAHPGDRKHGGRKMKSYERKTAAMAVIEESNKNIIPHFRLNEDGNPVFGRPTQTMIDSEYKKAKREEEKDRKMRHWNKISNRSFQVVGKDGEVLGYDYRGFCVPVKDIVAPAKDVDEVKRPVSPSLDSTGFVNLDIVRKSKSFVEKQRLIIQNEKEKEKMEPWAPSRLPFSTYGLNKTSPVLDSNAFVVWPQFAQCADNDVVVSIEYCDECIYHEILTHHDETKYKKMTENFKQLITKILSQYELKYTIFELSRSQSLKLLLIDDDTRKESLLDESYRSPMGYIRERFVHGIDTYQRIGVFEIQIQVRDRCDESNGKKVSHVLHSKLLSCSWPQKTALEVRMERILVDTAYSKRLPPSLERKSSLSPSSNFKRHNSFLENETTMRSKSPVVPANIAPKEHHEFEIETIDDMFLTLPNIKDQGSNIYPNHDTNQFHVEDNDIVTQHIKIDEHDNKSSTQPIESNSHVHIDSPGHILKVEVDNNDNTTIKPSESNINKQLHTEPNEYKPTRENEINKGSENKESKYSHMPLRSEDKTNPSKIDESDPKLISEDKTNQSKVGQISISNSTVNEIIDPKSHGNAASQSQEKTSRPADSIEKPPTFDNKMLAESKNSDEKVISSKESPSLQINSKESSKEQPVQTEHEHDFTVKDLGNENIVADPKSVTEANEANMISPPEGYKSESVKYSDDNQVNRTSTSVPASTDTNSTEQLVSVVSSDNKLEMKDLEHMMSTHVNTSDVHNEDWKDLMYNNEHHAIDALEDLLSDGKVSLYENDFENDNDDETEFEAKLVRFNTN